MVSTSCKEAANRGMKPRTAVESTPEQRQYGLQDGAEGRESVDDERLRSRRWRHDSLIDRATEMAGRAVVQVKYLEPQQEVRYEDRHEKGRVPQAGDASEASAA